MTLNNKIVWMSVVAVSLGVSSQAWAQDPGSCCVQSTSRLDALLNPAKGSDEKFFTSGGGPPNVMLVLDTSCSMADWPQSWPGNGGVPFVAGCAHPTIAGLGFDPATTYQPMVSNVSAGTPTYNTDWFDVNKYYEAPARGYGTDFAGVPKNANTGSAIASWGTSAAACVGMVNPGCVTCLDTKGYFIDSASVRRVWGKFLNFYAPRDSGAVLVLSHLVNDIRNVRFSVEVFQDQGDKNCWGSSKKICMFEEMGPKCGSSFPLDTSQVDNNRSSIEQALQNKLKFGSDTPLASAEYAAGHYLKNGTGVDPFVGWFGAGYATDSDFNEAATADKKSICASCGFNAIIVITDGEPNNEVVNIPTAITNQAVTWVGGGSCGTTAGGDLDPACRMAMVAKWWWEHDMRNDYTGVQKVATYTIGFSQDASSSRTLKTTAQYGGGKFYGATNTVALRDAVFAILDDVIGKNTSFSSAAIASVQSTGSTFAAILPRFSPQPSQPWVGSLRRFNLFNEFVEDWNLNPLEIQADGTPDKDKTDIWLVDSSMPAPPLTPTSSSRVVEDVDGNFVRWDGVTAATPYWEAGSKLQAMGAVNRRIYTVSDSNGDGAFTSADTPGATQPPLAFTAANSLALAPYLGIKGTSFCPSFLGTLQCVGGSNNGNACTTAAADCPAASVCVGGSKDGLSCNVPADCPSGQLECNGGSITNCLVDADCSYHRCRAGQKRCVGGGRNGNTCNDNGDCRSGGMDYPCTAGASQCDSPGLPQDNMLCPLGDSQCGNYQCQGICLGGKSAGNSCRALFPTDCDWFDCGWNNKCSGGPNNGIACGGMDSNCTRGLCSSAAGAATCTPVATACVASGGGSAGDMLTKWGLSVTALITDLGLLPTPIVVLPPTSQADLDDLCVKALIQFIRGQDLADEDGDGNRIETRRSVLGDIFHSSPVVVDPPVDKFLCDLGLHNQCIRTLFSYKVGGVPTPAPTPRAAGVAQLDCASTAVSRDPYDAYQWINRARDKVILVGANDGMLHAFHDGNAKELCPSGLDQIDYPANDSTTDPGTEVWAFIPPDLLPRLQEHVFGHAYFVDGDIMVRDIWEDKNGDGQKSWDEFHTVAVVAEGRGGTHYFALEIRFTTNGTPGLPYANLAVSDTANNIAAPGFRWMFPQPCSDDASLFGKTLLALSPKPPPIGPVLIERSTIVGGAGVDQALKPTAGTPRYECSGGLPGVPCDTSEQWVVMLGGGWSPGLEKGHGVYMVDAWNGKTNGRSDNLLWKMDYNPAAAGQQREPLRTMRYSITAPVAMVDYGTNTVSALDGFFDTATVGDTGGQLWLARFFRPGQIGADGLVSNWSGARTFEMDSKGDPNGDSNQNGDNRDVKSVWPFYYITSVGIQPDNSAMRIFTGTGNRYALLEPVSGTCRFDNPLACAKNGCDDTREEYKIEKVGLTNTFKLDSSLMHWPNTSYKGNETNSAWTVTNPAVAGACGANSTTVVTASISNKVKGCDQQSGPKVDFGDVRKMAVSCGKDASGNFFCSRSDSSTPNLADLAFTPKTSNINLLNNNRFFGIWAYGGTDLSTTRVFEEDRSTAGAWKTAKDFDGTRISDRTTANGGSGDLKDVSGTSCTTALACTVGGAALPTGKGWFYEYSGAAPANGLDNRTASGSALLASCVLWNSIFPATAATACGLASVATGRFHQANFITGEPNCAAGFKDSAGNFVRYIDRGIQAPPPEPATAIQISKTGQIRYSALLVEPGAKQATEASVTSPADVLQSVYEIPISRGMHKCRHTVGGSTNCVEAPP